MNRWRRLLLPALLMATASGSWAEGEPATVRDTWVNEFAGKHLEPLMRLYAADPVFHTASGERIEGNASIRALMKEVMETNTVVLNLRSLSTVSSGDLAYDSGDYRESITTGGVKKNL